MPGVAHEQFKTVQAFPPEDKALVETLFNNALLASTTGLGIDTRGFEDAKILVNNGVIAATGTLDVALFTSDVDDANDSSLSAVTDATFVQITDTDDGKSFVIRYRPNGYKRYLFVQTAKAGAVSHFYQIGVELGKNDVEPVTQDEAVNFDDK